MTLAWWARRDSNSLSHRRQIYSLLRLSYSGARPRKNLVLPGRIERPLPTYQIGVLPLNEGSWRSGPYSKRKPEGSIRLPQCACLLARSGLAEGGGIEPLTLRSPWFSGPVASHLAAPSIGTPARTRTANLRVLSAAPLPDWATGANWYARSASNRHCRGSRPRASYRLGYARMVRLLGFEPRLIRA